MEKDTSYLRVIRDVKVLDLGVPTEYGYVFPVSTGKDIIRQINESSVVGGIGPGNSEDISHHVFNGRIEEDSIVVDIGILPTEEGRELSNKLSSGEGRFYVHNLQNKESKTIGVFFR